jgi:hypothetical protein
MPATQVKLAQLKQDSATANQVIAWSATTGWTPTTLSSGGTSSGSLGTIQYSNGSGGFSGDSTKLFWNTTTQSLQITGTASAYAGTFTGNGGGLSITPSSNMTTAYTAINISGNSTNSVRQLITNTNTTATANASLSISTSGGDPFVTFFPSTGDTNAVTIGVDNSTPSDVFYIGPGANPSSISGPKLLLDKTNDIISINTTNDVSQIYVSGNDARVAAITSTITGGASNQSEIILSASSTDMTAPIFYITGETNIGLPANKVFTTSYSNSVVAINVSDATPAITLKNRANNKSIVVDNSAITVINSDGLSLNNGASGTLTLKPNGATPYSYTLTFPSSSGGAGQTLISDGTGVLSWSAIENTSNELITPSQLTSDQNNWNPTGLSTARIIFVTANTSLPVITGITAPSSSTSYREIKIVNTGSNTILFTHQDTDSSAANRFILTQRVFGLTEGETATFIYDNTADRWRLLEYSTDLELNPKVKRFSNTYLTAVGTTSPWTFTNLNGGALGNNSSSTNGEFTNAVFLHTGTSATGLSIIQTAGWSVHRVLALVSTRTPNCSIFSCRIRIPSNLSDATQTFQVRAGYVNALYNSSGHIADALANLRGMFFVYGSESPMSGNIVARVTNGTATDNVAITTAAVDTLYLLEVAVLPDNRVLFYANGTLVAKVANTNVGANYKLFPAVSIVKSVGTTQRSITIDTINSTTYLP